MIGDSQQMALARVGGGLGFTGAMAGLSILILGCCGFDAAMMFSPVPIALGLAGGVIGLSTNFRSGIFRSGGIPDSTILAGLFLALLAMLGGLLEAAVWLQWPILFNQHV